MALKGKKISAAELVALRDLLDMTQEEFASFVDVSINTLANWESGKNGPSRRNFGRLVEKSAAALGRTPESIRVRLGVRNGSPQPAVDNLSKSPAILQSKIIGAGGVSASRPVSEWIALLQEFAGEAMPVKAEVRAELAKRKTLAKVRERVAEALAEPKREQRGRKAG